MNKNRLSFPYLLVCMSVYDYAFTVLSIHVLQDVQSVQLLSLQSIGGGVSTLLVCLEDALALKRQNM